MRTLRGESSLAVVDAILPLLLLSNVRKSQSGGGTPTLSPLRPAGNGQNRWKDSRRASERQAEGGGGTAPLCRARLSAPAPFISPARCMTAFHGFSGHSPSLTTKHAAAAQAATRPLSNSERKRQARARDEVERLRAARASAGEITAFRTEEQYWKDRTAEPDWRNAFGKDEDAVRWSGTVDVVHGERLEEGVWLDRHGRSWHVQRCLLSGGRTAILFSDKPGALP